MQFKKMDRPSYYIIENSIEIIFRILFESSGYLWSTISHIIMLLIGLFLLIIFYKRIVPLKVVPEIGVPTVYKSGVFYRL